MATKLVSITASGFSPQSTTCKMGDKITFTNADATVHGVTFDPPAAGASAVPAPSGDIPAGGTHDVTFPAKGSFSFKDDHSTFTGTVSVS
jgi:plastocyanin